MEDILKKLSQFPEEEGVSYLWDEIMRYAKDNTKTAHNLIVGIPQKGDTILWQELMYQEEKVWDFAEYTLCYPPENSTHIPKAVINMIAVLDVKNDDFGGMAVIESGGVGNTSVKVKLTAGFWRSMSFQVIIIGRYLQNPQIKNNVNTNDTFKFDKNEFQKYQKYQ